MRETTSQPSTAPPRFEDAQRARIHDLRAPMNALSLNVELLQQSVDGESDKDPATQREQVATLGLLREEIGRLARLLDGFQGRAESASARAPTRMELGRTLRQLARLVREQSRREDVHLRALPRDEPTHVSAAGDALREASLNLVLNAIQASPVGGEVRLRVLATPRRARLLIEDDGPGIPKDLQERVFEMGFSTRTEGTGIGLAVSRSLVEGMGGRLRLYSLAGRGTTAEISLRRERERGCA